MKAYNVKTKQMDTIVKITGEKKLKNGATMVMGVNSQGQKLTTIKKK
jgi:hypothetical protein